MPGVEQRQTSIAWDQIVDTKVTDATDLSGTYKRECSLSTEQVRATAILGRQRAVRL